MQSSTKKTPLPLVSCLCITKNGIDQLSRAAECFQSQTYPNKELVIVCKGETKEIEEWFRKKGKASVKLVEVLDSTLSLGDLRNIALSRATGEYFCQWDDDDWYHRDRLKIQVSQILKYKQPASILYYLLIFDQEKRDAYFSQRRIWEGSLLCKRSVFPMLKFQPWPWNEDANFIYQVLRNFKILPIMIPGLYIYVCHGKNTSGADYFQRLFDNSQKLSDRTSRLIGRIIDGKYTIKEASRLLESDFLLKELNFLHGYLDSIKRDQA